MLSKAAPTHRADPTQTLTQAIEKLSLASDLKTITHIVADAARSLTGADGATFVLRENQNCYYVDENSISPLWKGKRFPLDVCISGWCMKHGEVVTIPNITTDPRIPQDAYQPTFVKSLCMVPIRIQSPIGAIGNYWKDQYTPTLDEIKLLQILANSSAIALENLELKNSLFRNQTPSHTHDSISPRELETLFCTLAHDLKSPIVSMVGFAELLQFHLAQSIENPASKYIQSIIQTGFRASQQIEKMLSIYCISNRPLEKKTLSLSQLAQEVAQQLQNLTPQRSIEWHIEPGIDVYADPVLMSLALENLFSNAIKYSSKKSRTQIWLKRIPSPTQNMLSFAVEDRGAGFDSSQSQLLFRPLVRLHDPSEFAGHGLGLSSVARIILLHGGKIRAEGRKDVGATFFIEIPTLS